MLSLVNGREKGSNGDNYEEFKEIALSFMAKILLTAVPNTDITFFLYFLHEIPPRLGK